MRDHTEGTVSPSAPRPEVGTPPDLAFPFTLPRNGRPITLFGTGRGSRTREFTYGGDIVEATAAVLQPSPTGEVICLVRSKRERLMTLVRTTQLLTGTTLDESLAAREANDMRAGARSGYTARSQAPMFG